MIALTTEQHEVNRDCVGALVRDPNLYQRNGALVHVLRDVAPRGPIERPVNSPRIVALGSAIVSDRLTANARFFKWSKTEWKWVPAHPPTWCVSAVHQRGAWEGIRALDGVVETPVLRPDGTVLQVPGYDAATRLLLEPAIAFPEVPENPSREDAFRAASEIEEVFCDFPFEADAHRAACFASLLTPFARPAYEGTTPAFIFDANSPATGKSLTADAISMVFTGRKFPRTTNSETDEEWKKKITSIALAADPIILIDNVSTPLGCESLDAVFTATIWKERVLGTNEKPAIEMRTVWYVTGNNIMLSGDMYRRGIHIRLRTTEEHPEDRQDFVHPDLLSWIQHERPRLVRAVLTILRSYCAAGRPDMGAKRWGSFEEWARLVPHACLWAGWSDPLEARGRSDDDHSPAVAAFRALVIGLHGMNIGASGITVREILSKLEREQKTAEDKRAQYNLSNSDEAAQADRLWPVPHVGLRNALDELAPPSSAGRAYDPRRIGKQLEKYKGRVVSLDGKRLSIVRCKDTRDGAARWTVGNEGAGSAGSAGSFSSVRAENSPPSQ